MAVATLASQSYVERPPVSALASLVSSVWIQRVAPTAQPYTHRNIPSGGVELVCAPDAAPRVLGPLTRPLAETPPPGTTRVGMRFRPGAAFPVLNLPASELVDVAVDADALWGHDAAAIGEAVHAAASPDAALATLQRQVIRRIRAEPPPDPLVLEAVRRLRWRTEDVGPLATSLSISERHLRRRCFAAAGLAPKALHRTLRFQGFLALAQHAIAQGRAPADDGIALLAAEAGYADQSHLSRECARLTGLSPRAFLRAADRTCACGHEHAASYVPLMRSRARAAAGGQVLV